MVNCNFTDATLLGTILPWDLSLCTFTRVDFSDLDPSDHHFCKANLSNLDLSEATLVGCGFTDANLVGTTLPKDLIVCISLTEISRFTFSVTKRR
jgi:uncharacterized protein YjbI with pentapeptide repeats